MHGKTLPNTSSFRTWLPRSLNWVLRSSKSPTLPQDWVEKENHQHQSPRMDSEFAEECARNYYKSWRKSTHPHEASRCAWNSRTLQADDTPSFLKHLNQLSVVAVTTLFTSHFPYLLQAIMHMSIMSSSKFKVQIAGDASSLYMINLLHDQFRSDQFSDGWKITL